MMLLCHVFAGLFSIIIFLTLINNVYSAFTTFGNVVADTGWLLLSGRVLSAIGNVALNIIASIIFYEIGKILLFYIILVFSKG